MFFEPHHFVRRKRCGFFVLEPNLNKYCTEWLFLYVEINSLVIFFSGNLFCSSLEVIGFVVQRNFFFYQFQLFYSKDGIFGCSVGQKTS